MSKFKPFLLSSKVYDSIDPEIPYHTVKELKISNLKRKFLIKMKRWIKIPYKKGNTSFVICISQTKKINE